MAITTMSYNATMLSGTNADRTAMTTAQLGSVQYTFFESDTKLTYKWTGTEWQQTGTNGAAHVAVGSTGQARNRNINAAATTYAPATNSATWATGVTDVSIQVPNTASVTGVLVVYDAPNDATAAAWLADTGGITSDVAYDIVGPNQTFSRQFTSGITRIDVLPYGAATRVVIGAV